MRGFTISILFIAHISCIGQDSKNVFQYFDKNWKIINNPMEAVYYRTAEEIAGNYLITDYYKSTDTKQMEAVCSEIEPGLIHNGETIWYYASGSKREEGYYRDNKRTGVFKTYYENGSLHSEIVYEKDGQQHLQYWSMDGTPLLNKGTGFVDATHSISEFSISKEIKDYLLVGAYYSRPEQGDTIYSVVETNAEFEGGMDKVYEVISKHLKGKYPKEARRLGIEGRVIIEFVIDKEGVLAEKKVQKGIGGGCDELALEAFNNLTNWKPALHHGKPVKIKMFMPIVFRLN